MKETGQEALVAETMIISVDHHKCIEWSALRRYAFVVDSLDEGSYTGTIRLHGIVFKQGGRGLLFFFRFICFAHNTFLLHSQKQWRVIFALSYR